MEKRGFVLFGVVLIAAFLSASFFDSPNKATGMQVSDKPSQEGNVLCECPFDKYHVYTEGGQFAYKDMYIEIDCPKDAWVCFAYNCVVAQLKFPSVPPNDPYRYIGDHEIVYDERECKTKA